MRFKAGTFVAFLLLGGCDSRAPGTFAEAQPFRQEAEEVWQQRLKTTPRNNGQGEVRGVLDGHAEISLDGGSAWKPAAVGTVFTTGATIRTDARASLDLSIGDYGDRKGWPLRIEPASFVRIVRLDMEHTGIEIVAVQMIELERGRLSGRQMDAASSVMVRTQRGIIEPRGEFEAEAEGAVQADGGYVHAGGEMIKLQAGQKLNF